MNNINRKKKTTFIMTLGFIILSFIAILLIEHIKDIDDNNLYVDIFKIDDKKNELDDKENEVITFDNVIIGEEDNNSIPSKKVTTYKYTKKKDEVLTSNDVKEEIIKVDEKEEDKDDGNFIVDWLERRKANIFSNKYFENNLIAPGVSSEYYFMVINKIHQTVKYNIDFNETNESNIDIKYRLKQNGKYIIGNNDLWVAASELNAHDIIIEDKNSDIYILEWKWDYFVNDFTDQKDTSIGESISSYSLSIEIKAEMEDE